MERRSSDDSDRGDDSSRLLRDDDDTSTSLLAHQGSSATMDGIPDAASSSSTLVPSWVGGNHASDALMLRSDVITSTPNVSAVERPHSPIPEELTDSDVDKDCPTEFSADSISLMGDSNDRLKVPIIGHEIMENRAKFTVFKLHVQKNESENWFVFRRYTDFVWLNSQLKLLFPVFRLSLPSKRWFGDNFDLKFLEERQRGLQAFVNNIIGHREVSQSRPVRDFLCLDDPPGPHESLEESRALCDCLEESMYQLKLELNERDEKILELEDLIVMYKTRVDSLENVLKAVHLRSGSLKMSTDTLNAGSIRNGDESLP